MRITRARRQAWQRGDTIIEVMFVLVMLALAISIAYATSNRSLLSARQAEENAEAARLAETQVERLRLLNANSSIFTVSPKYFCIDGASNAKVNLPALTSPGDYGNYPAAGPCVQGEYHIAVEYKDSSDATSPNTFIVSVVWDDVRGQGQNSLRLPYRLYLKT